MVAWKRRRVGGVVCGRENDVAPGVLVPGTSYTLLLIMSQASADERCLFSTPGERGLRWRVFSAELGPSAAAACPTLLDARCVRPTGGLPCSSVKAL